MEHRSYTNLTLKSILVITLLILSIIFIFKESFNYGLQFDNVFRVNNLIPVLNDSAQPYNQSIYHINVFGIKIPMMYKNYVSSLVVLKYLPIGLFDNNLFAFRFMNMFYFAITIIGFFIITSRYHFWFASICSILIMSSPMLYPEILFGLQTLHILFTTLSIHLFYTYHKTLRINHLFFAVFCLFFSANLAFYGIWTIGALTITSIIFYPSHWITVLKSFKRILVVIFAMFIGLFNFIAYNFSTQFATFKPLFLKLFKSEEYRKNPIDYKPIGSLSDEISMKFNNILSFFGDYYYIYLLIFGTILILYVLTITYMMHKKLISQHKSYLFPIANLLILFIFIVISPNTTRAAHYAYLMPFIEISIITVLFLVIKLFDKNRVAIYITYSVLIGLIILNSVSLNNVLSSTNKMKGTGYFSPAIFDLNAYIQENELNSEKLIHTQWGMYSQLYFLNNGEYKIRSLVFELKGARTNEDKMLVLKNFFLSNNTKNTKNSDYLYFPIYTNLDKGISNTFFDFIHLYGGKLMQEKVFYEKNGKPLIALYKLENLQELYTRIDGELVSAEIEKNLRIVDFGPRQKDFITTISDFPMWFKTENHSRNTKVVINNILLKTQYYEDHLTALVKKNIVERPGDYQIQLYDSKMNLKSEPVILVIKEKK